MALVANYPPTTWVDTVTPVDSARMTNIETAVDAHADAINALDTRLAAEEAMPDIPTVVNGQWLKGSSGAMVWSAIAISDVTNLQTTLNGKQDSSAKGVANGYASLDSGGKVPSTQLPVSIDLRWAGTYAAATAYKEGDVVIYNGVSYMALRPSTGETPAPWSSAAGGALTYYSAALASDFALVAGNAYQDPGISIASIPAGTYLTALTAEVIRAGNAGWLTWKVWDGTAAPVLVMEMNTASFSSGQGYSQTSVGIVTLSAVTTLKASISQAANGHTVKAATVNGSLAPASVLTMVKIA